ncbi:MAG: (Fe-S)-binding protein [Archaeoglobaceae archaeon]|uniref:(Fe-S)-binding protein n=1 Tax=Archaeoglobus fulgidus TaxID=2234 RepID=A0A7J3M3G3_ARCFL
MLSESMLSTCIQCGICSSSCSMRFNMNIRKAVASYIGRGSFWTPELWNCTNCLICQERCPRGIKLVEAINEARAETIEKGELPKDLQRFLENIQKFSNPFGAFKRPSFEAKTAKKGEFEFLLFLGCAVYDSRVEKVAKRAIELLKMAKVNFAILEKELCCGNDVKAIGEKGLFELLKEKNSKFFEELGVKKIITISPHCYNALKNYYGIETYHIAQVLLEKVENAELRFSSTLEARVTYHDPCYLSRHNDVVEEPRTLLSSVPGIELVEMQRNRKLSLCCGGGSGGIVRDFRWRPSMERIREAMLTGSEILATSCPFCLVMLEDAVKTKNSGLRVFDVVEILYSAITGSPLT